MKKTVAILGCGPAGLLAAHAAASLEYPVAIFSKPEPSKLSGAQFLHRAIPGITDDAPDVQITYKIIGDADTYRQKVYGKNTPGFVSFQFLEDDQKQDAWNLIKVYDNLWNVFESSIQGNATELNVKVVQEMIDSDNFHTIINTIPLPAICKWNINDDEKFFPHTDIEREKSHVFRSQEIWLKDEQYMDTKDNTVVYNGTWDASWYRTSKLFGHPGTEWSQQGAKPIYPDLKFGIKPVNNNCDCFPEVLREGRFGKWEKGVLTHHAYEGALDALR